MKPEVEQQTAEIENADPTTKSNYAEFLHKIGEVIHQGKSKAMDSTKARWEKLSEWWKKQWGKVKETTTPIPENSSKSKSPETSKTEVKWAKMENADIKDFNKLLESSAQNIEIQNLKKLFTTHPQLQPENKVEIGGREFFLSDKINDGQRDHVIGYTKGTNGTLEVRFFYKS
ncbi:MAG: hypothetical protein LBG52_07465 [Candidatus Peribacteria bacterium]|nr:hypothetical protein [Candidatus Peribacteria bacterium]